MIGYDAPSAQDVVRVRWPLVGNYATEYDVGGLFDGKLGALDEVREVGLVERERRISLGPSNGRHAGERGMVAQCRMKGPELNQAVWIAGAAQKTGDGGRCGQIHVAGAEQGSDNRIEDRSFLLEVEGGRQRTDLVTQPVRRFFTRTADESIKPFLDLGSAESASHESTARTRPTHVLQISARSRTEEKFADKRSVGRQRSWTAPRPEDKTRKCDILAAPGSQTDRTVAGWSVLQRRPVGNQCSWKIPGDDVPQVSCHNRLGRIGHVAGIEPRGQLTQLPSLDCARHCTRDRLVGHERFRHVVQRFGDRHFPH